MKFVFRKKAHERYGYGTLKVGETVAVQVDDRAHSARVRSGVCSHGQYYSKKFKTSLVAESMTLHIKRIL